MAVGSADGYCRLGDGKSFNGITNASSSIMNEIPSNTPAKAMIPNLPNHSSQDIMVPSSGSSQAMISGQGEASEANLFATETSFDSAPLKQNTNATGEMIAFGFGGMENPEPS